MLKESGDSAVAHLTFFGGETLLNFPVLEAHARLCAPARGRARQGSRLQPHHERDAAAAGDHRLPGRERRRRDHLDRRPARRSQDKFRVFHNGTGSYDVVAPKIKELLQRHRSRPIGARVTLTRARSTSSASTAHLTEEIGFWEVGFAPVTTSPAARLRDRRRGLRRHAAAVPASSPTSSSRRRVENRHHGFSNVRDTLEEIHKGMSKAYPCGAGLGLMGVATDGDVALCHRFAGSDAHKLGTVRDGIDREAQQAFLEQHHIDEKTDCSTCWARPLCSGGCYHEAHTRYGDTTKAEPALLRMDSRLDRRLPAGLRRAGGAEPGISRAVRPRRRWRRRCR